MKTTFLIFLFSSTTIFAQNLVQNGAFISGTDAWTPLNSLAGENTQKKTIEFSDDYMMYELSDSYLEKRFVELDYQSAIQQTISTNETTNYTLTFAYAHRPNSGDKELVIIADDKVIYKKTIKNNEKEGSFIYQSVPFQAKRSQTSLGFYVQSISGAEDRGLLITDIFCEERANLDEILEAQRQLRYKVE